MIGYVSQISETAQILKGTGFEINEEWIGSLLLARLLEKFAPMIMNYGIAINSDVIKTKLLDMSPEIGDHDSEVALWSKQKSKPSQNFNSKSGKQTSTPNVKKLIKCYKCKKFGHFKSKCPNKYVNDKKEQNAFTVAFLIGKFSKMDWYADWGPSAHLTVCNGLMHNISDSEIDEIMLANNTHLTVSCIGDVNIKSSIGNIDHKRNIMCARTNYQPTIGESID